MNRKDLLQSCPKCNWHFEAQTYPESARLIDLLQVKVLELKNQNQDLFLIVNKAKDDYWFMINLLEKYSVNEAESVKDCLARMKFRKPMFDKIKGLKDA